MNPQSLMRTARAAKIQRARHSLIDFVELATPGYKAGNFHHQLAHELEEFSDAVLRGESPAIIVEAPPRHGKSRLVVEAFSAWHMMRSGWTHEIMLTSYAQRPARARSRRTKEIVRDRRMAPVFGEIPALITDSVDEWIFSTGGAVYAAGVGAGLTSFGCNVLIVDDPVKDRADSLSFLKREKNWDWFTSTAYTRRDDDSKGSGTLIVLTRWNPDDMGGRVKHAMGDDIKVLCFPAIAERTERDHRGLVVREPGDALHPERFGLKRLAKTRKHVGKAVWESLYQQRPEAGDGNIWHPKHWRHHSGCPSPLQRKKLNWIDTPDLNQFDRVILSCDFSFGAKKKTSSFEVIQAWAELDGVYFLLDEMRDRWGFRRARSALLLMVQKFDPVWVLVEAKANGAAIMDDLEEVLGDILHPIEPDGSKTARAEAAGPVIAAGRVYLPDHGVYFWVPDWIDEAKKFPTGQFNDRVDAASQAIRFLKDTGYAPEIDHI